MNKMNRVTHILLMGVAALLTVGCSSDNDETNVPDDGLKVRRITIHQVDDDATRATLSESGNVLNPFWEKGDSVRWANLTRVQSGFPSGTKVYATNAGNKTDFTGEVTCVNGDRLSIIYPAPSTIKFPVDGNGYSYTITLSGQDGTLSGLAKNYHYVYGIADITTTTSNTAEAIMGKTKSLLAVCKFSFVDKSNKTPIEINTLEISYDAMGEYQGKYPQTAHVNIYENRIIEQANVVAIADTATTTGPLTINANQSRTDKKTVYVALMPTYNSDDVAVNNSRKFKFVVNDTYSGTFHAKLKPGVFVKAENLELTSN